MPEVLPPAPAAAAGWRHWLWLALVVIVADQWSKQLILATLPEGGLLRLTGWFDLVLAYNRGAAFSLLNQSGPLPRVLFSVVAVLASAALVWMIRSQRGQPWAQCGAALVLGGALGNLADRVRLGAVVDFIQWHLGSAYWPAFNVADSAISVGACVLLLSSLRPSGAKP